MVTGNDDHLQAGQLGGGAEQEVVEEFFGGSRGVGGVEHVACDDECIGLLVADGGEEPVEEMPVLVGAVVAVEVVAEMPVGGMQNFHWGNESCLVQQGAHGWCPLASVR